MKYFYEICEEFITREYVILFSHTAPRLSVDACQTIQILGHWYCKENYTYIKIFDFQKDSHLLQLYVLDRLVIKEISYQTVVLGFTTFLQNHLKKNCPTFPINIAKITPVNFPQAKEV